MTHYYHQRFLTPDKVARMKALMFEHFNRLIVKSAVALNKKSATTAQARQANARIAKRKERNRADTTPYELDRYNFDDTFLEDVLLLLVKVIYISFLTNHVQPRASMHSLTLKTCGSSSKEFVKMFFKHR